MQSTIPVSLVCIFLAGLKFAEAQYYGSSDEQQPLKTGKQSQ